MAYDEKLATRIRDCLKGKRGVTEKKMFGGLCFLHRGNMCCGVVKNKLMIRVPKEDHGELLKKPHTQPMTFTGKSLKGMLYISPAGIKTKAGLSKWVNLSHTYIKTLPAKTK